MSTWKCCGCISCRKMSGRRGFQLEDVNHAVLRVVFLFQLILFSFIFFLVGLLLLPLGYLCFFIQELKLLNRCLAVEPSSLMLKQVQNKRSKILLLTQLCCKLIMSLPGFLLFHFQDTFDFIKHCWEI